MKSTEYVMYVFRTDTQEHNTKFTFSLCKSKKGRRKKWVERALVKTDTFKIGPTALRCYYFHRTCVVNSF